MKPPTIRVFRTNFMIVQASFAFSHNPPLLVKKATALIEQSHMIV